MKFQVVFEPTCKCTYHIEEGLRMAGQVGNVRSPYNILAGSIGYRRFIITDGAAELVEGDKAAADYIIVSSPGGKPFLSKSRTGEGFKVRRLDKPESVDYTPTDVEELENAFVGLCIAFDVLLNEPPVHGVDTKEFALRFSTRMRRRFYKALNKPHD